MAVGGKDRQRRIQTMMTEPWPYRAALKLMLNRDMSCFGIPFYRLGILEFKLMCDFPFFHDMVHRRRIQAPGLGIQPVPSG